jgi:uncharacterized membrane protein
LATPAKRIVSLVAAVIAVSQIPGQSLAENLNEKYGPSWSCAYITIGMPLAAPCYVCEQQGMDFFRDSETTGHCVARAARVGEPPAGQTGKNECRQSQDRYEEANARFLELVPPADQAISCSFATQSLGLFERLHALTKAVDDACNDLSQGRAEKQIPTLVRLIELKAKACRSPASQTPPPAHEPEEAAGNPAQKPADGICQCDVYLEPPEYCAKFGTPKREECRRRNDRWIDRCTDWLKSSCGPSAEKPIEMPEVFRGVDDLCPYSRNGVCNEPDECPRGTDTTDCGGKRATPLPEQKADQKPFTLTICNQTDKPIYVAFGFTENERLRVKGWSVAPPMQCGKAGQFSKGHFYYYARTPKGALEWSGKSAELCVNLDALFNWESGPICEAGGGQRFWFSGVFVERDTMTVTFKGTK